MNLKKRRFAVFSGLIVMNEKAISDSLRLTFFLVFITFQPSLFNPFYERQ